MDHEPLMIQFSHGFANMVSFFLLPAFKMVHLNSLFLWKFCQFLLLKLSELVVFCFHIQHVLMNFIQHVHLSFIIYFILCMSFFGNLLTHRHNAFVFQKKICMSHVHSDVLIERSL